MRGWPNSKYAPELSFRIMKAGMIAWLLVLAVAGCTCKPPVQVVQVSPEGCKLLGDVGHGQVQCGEGAASQGLLERLKEETRALGGNTLQCCEVGSEAVVLAGYDRHGHIACTEFFERTGHAYACPVPTSAR